MDDLIAQSRELERARIISETAKIPWQELQRFFAAGKVIWVAGDLDLVDVAWSMQRDDAKQISTWMEEFRLAPVSDDQARQWVDHDSLLWAVAIKPWVLVQDLKVEN